MIFGGKGEEKVAEEREHFREGFVGLSGGLSVDGIIDDGIEAVKTKGGLRAKGLEGREMEPEIGFCGVESGTVSFVEGVAVFLTTYCLVFAVEVLADVFLPVSDPFFFNFATVLVSIGGRSFGGL